MRTIRRLYFYAVAFVSLEVILWGLIGLARSAFDAERAAIGGADRLAQALALLLVGAPVFGFHWWKSQRDAARGDEERASGVRAVFLYAALLATLLPIVQNLLALADRSLLDAARLPRSLAFFGGQQTWSDNLIAVLMNALAAAYFIQVTRRDWQASQPKDSLVVVRRIYRYVWLLYGLALVVAGVQQTLRFLLGLIPNPSGPPPAALAHGVTLLLIGAPLWVCVWLVIQKAQAEPAERASLLRLGVLYFLSLSGVTVVLAAAGIAADTLLRFVLGYSMTVQEIFGKINGALSIGVPLGGVWAYYGLWLGRAISDADDTTQRAGMRRLYFYILSALGLGAAFTGLAALTVFLVDRLAIGTAQIGSLTGGLAALAAGLPLWLSAWTPMQTEALAAGDSGDHARRSLIRKFYLYLTLFASVVGGMIAAGSLLYTLLLSLLGQPRPHPPAEALKFASLLLLFAGLGVYHGLALGRDGKLASAALGAKHAAFPVLLFDPGDGTFARDLAAAIQKHAPAMPVSIQPAGQAVPEDAAPKAAVLPADLALDPPEPLRRWLGKFNGSRLAVPRAAEAGAWIVAGATQSDFHHAALALRALAEGQPPRPRAGTSGWALLLYVLGGLIGLNLLCSLIGMSMSFLGN